MTDINAVTLVGRITKDADVKVYNNSTITSFNLAVNASKKQGDKYVDETSFIDCKTWNNYKDLTKGKKVCITGHLKQERWEKDGQKNSRIVVMVDLLNYLDSAKQNTPTQQTPNQVQAIANAFNGNVSTQQGPLF